MHSDPIENPNRIALLECQTKRVTMNVKMKPNLTKPNLTTNNNEKAHSKNIDQ